MAFIRAPQAAEDEPQKIVTPTNYSEMSEQELELAYEDALWVASGFGYEFGHEEDDDKPLARCGVCIGRAVKRLARMDAMTTSSAQVVPL